MERITARDIAGFQEYLQLCIVLVGENEQDHSPRWYKIKSWASCANYALFALF